MLGLEPERVDEWRRGEVLFPSVRITPTTIIDLFGADSRARPTAPTSTTSAW